MKASITHQDVDLRPITHHQTIMMAVWGACWGGGTWYKTGTLSRRGVRGPLAAASMQEKTMGTAVPSKRVPMRKPHGKPCAGPCYGSPAESYESKISRYCTRARISVVRTWNLSISTFPLSRRLEHVSKIGLRGSISNTITLYGATTEADFLLTPK
jgi:hypothetical protein